MMLLASCAMYIVNGLLTLTADLINNRLGCEAAIWQARRVSVSVPL